VRIEPDFLPEPLSRGLRATFDGSFSDNRSVTAERFCWDYWHVPGQYTQLRTPAQDYFPPKLFARLERVLLDYGKEQLGCIGLTPIWLSYYVGAGHCVCSATTW
jgi:hypothetical protein